MSTPSADTTNVSLTRDLHYAARYYVGSRRGIATLATVAILTGLAFNWSWLVATGIAPILLTALPCAVMCGLGLCMNRLFGNSCKSQSSQPKSAAESSGNVSDAPRVLAVSSRSPDALTSCSHEEVRNGAPADFNKSQAPDERRSPNA